MAESTDSNRTFWPVFVIVAALSVATVWRFSPELGQHLPDSVRASICSLFGRTATVSAPAAEATPADDDATAAEPAQPEPDARTGVQAAAAAAEKAPRTKPKTEPVADARKQLPRQQQQSPSVSPYLEPAAKALREFRQLNADFERRRGDMPLAEQRAVMKKLHALNQRVESLNRKHREWKQSHPQAAGSSSR